eukprot:gene12967-12788_t
MAPQRRITHLRLTRKTLKTLDPMPSLAPLGRDHSLRLNFEPYTLEPVPPPAAAITHLP